MPQEEIAQVASEVELPWLAALNKLDPRKGKPYFDHTKISVPQGGTVFLDRANQRFRLKKPEGGILVWDKFKRIMISPDRSWDMCWHEPGRTDNPSFGFAEEFGELKISMEHMEGHEHLFADFVAAFNASEMGLDSFSVEDGRYESNQLVDFMVVWGGDGVPPSLTPVEETISAELDVPWEFLLEILNDTTVECRKTKKMIAVESGFYNGKVSTYNYQTGEVVDIRFLNSNWNPAFNTSAKELLRLVAEQTAEIVEVYQDKLPKY